MVKQIEKQGKTFYQCEKCELKYKDRERAEKCEMWCKENNSCNIKITNRAIK